LVWKDSHGSDTNSIYIGIFKWSSIIAIQKQSSHKILLSSICATQCNWYCTREIYFYFMKIHSYERKLKILWYEKIIFGKIHKRKVYYRKSFPMPMLSACSHTSCLQEESERDWVCIEIEKNFNNSYNIAWKVLLFTKTLKLSFQSF
jgi:hypothetical protein